MPDGNDAAAAVAAPFAYRYRFVNVEFDEAAGALRVGGKDVAVEPLPLALLLELLRRPNEVVTHAELLDTIWQGKVTVPHVVTSAVNKLRKALGEQGAARLVNVPRVGYRFSGPVERVAAGRQQRVPSDLQAGAEVPGRSGYRLVRRLGNHPHSAPTMSQCSTASSPSLAGNEPSSCSLETVMFPSVRPYDQQMASRTTAA